MVGVNKFQLKEEPAIEILEVDNRQVRDAQLARLARIRTTRDEAKCVAALKALGDAARNGTGNLLALSIEATRARATVGEISSALEGVYGRYQATIRSISGVYAGEWEGDAGLERIRGDIASWPLPLPASHSSPPEGRCKTLCRNLFRTRTIQCCNRRLIKSALHHQPE